MDSEETRRELIAHGHTEALRLQTREEAEANLGDFFDDYVSEWHPAKDADGRTLFSYVDELLKQPDLQQPQCCDLLELLGVIFAATRSRQTCSPYSDCSWPLLRMDSGMPGTITVLRSGVLMLALEKDPRNLARSTSTVDTSSRDSYDYSTRSRRLLSKMTNIDRACTTCFS